MYLYISLCLSLSLSLSLSLYIYIYIYIYIERERERERERRQNEAILTLANKWISFSLWAEPARGREERLEKIHIFFFFLFHGLPKIVNFDLVGNLFF